MARKRKRNKKINPAVMLVILILVLIAYIVMAYFESLNNGESTQDSHAPSSTSETVSSGEITVSSGELGEVEYHFIDVCQGDATLIRTPEGDILIDTGENSAEEDLKNYLDICGVDVLQYAVFTHPDSDHIGGADMVLAEYEVLNVIKPDFEKDTQVYKRMMEGIEAEGCKVYNALPGETYSLGEFDMFVLGPDPESQSKFGIKLDSNNSSIVIRATWGSTTALLTGDAEEPEEKSIMMTYTAADLGSMLLKVGHHGSRTSSTEGWLAAVNPKIAVISCGLDNKYGHPHAEVLAKLEAYVGDKIYRTDKLGNIVFVTDGKAFTYQE
ncbi:MAG: MBL fold metallo-hydrolase [Clostridia bacterium]|nr:MBL fold metallo-hydrolase [Clostridia bacterium]